MRAVLLVVAVTVALSAAFAGRPASAAEGVETFTGGCTFTASDRIRQPVLPVEVTSGTLRGNGTCTGTVADSAGRRHRLDGAPASFSARRGGLGGCSVTTASGTGRLTLPGGAIDFSVAEQFVGPLGTGQLTGVVGGSAVTSLELVDGRPGEVARNCVAGRTQEPDFRLQLISPGISG